jgi:hypothetical protein
MCRDTRELVPESVQQAPVTPPFLRAGSLPCELRLVATKRSSHGRLPVLTVTSSTCLLCAKSQLTYFNFQVPGEQASSSSSSEAPAVHSALTCTRASLWGGSWFDPNGGYGAGSASRLVELCDLPFVSDDASPPVCRCLSVPASCRSLLSSSC